MANNNKSRRFLVESSRDSKFSIGFQIISSIYQDDFSAFDLLIDSLNDINKPIGDGKSKWTPLMFSVHRRRYKFVDKLLKMNANPNCIDHKNKKSALHYACSKGYNDIVKLLLSSKSITNINYNDTEEGESALYDAIKKNRVDCVKLLLDYTLHSQICDINVATKTIQQTPILIACDKGDIEIVKLLINYKYMQCDINSMDYKGYTPLMKSVAKNHYDIVRLLLSKNMENPLPAANINICNKYGQCCTMIAVRINNFRLSKYLLNNNDDDSTENSKNFPELYHTDCKNRTILDQCNQYHTDKRITNYVKRLLYVDIHSVIETVHSSKNHDIVPYLPTGIIQCICIATY